ncbi:hypothetical protein TSOC_012202 [Tetrabaena socialis]|uniref:MIB/HERC2 domain-containing protein n=1 Tax=Tetrabaena socialis TaxID=47790 RepID=A0A2J7ZNM4_9CHLO|nr:hypothetical protein TSOC_012202 [Tetrabaena socialis]|eukprot:PNH01873.1 hypothetical protein TSOC_012202 [Tetrabaena socialis]
MNRWLGRSAAASGGRPETQPAEDPAAPDPPAAAALAAEPAAEDGTGPTEPPGAAWGAELTRNEAPTAPAAGVSRPAAAAAAEAAQPERPPAGSSSATAAPPPPADRLGRVSRLLATAQPLTDPAVFALLANLAAEQSAQQAELFAQQAEMAELRRAVRPRKEEQPQGPGGGGDSSGGGLVAELQAQVEELRAQVAQGARQLMEAEQRAEAAAQQTAAAEKRAEEAAKQAAAAELLAVRAAGGQEVSTGAAGSAKDDVPPWAAGGMLVDFWEPAVGRRVVRGPDWCYGEQDGGAGSEGVVVGESNEYRCCLVVRWLGRAEEFAYRAGGEFKQHDLRFAVPRPVPAPSDPAQQQQQK